MRLSQFAALACVLGALVLSHHSRALGAPDPATRAGPGASSSGTTDAHGLVEKLYTANGKLPIRDMIVELEASDASDETGNLAPSGSDKIYFKYPNKLRVDSVIKDPGGPLDGIQAIIIRDGTNRWQFVSMGQYPVKKGPDEPTPTLNLPFNIQHYSQDAARKYELTGKQQVDGVPVDVVRITNPQSPDDVRTVWVDSARLVPLRLEMLQPGEGGTTQTRVDYKDVRRLEDGRYIPFRLEIYEGGTLQRVRVYKGVKVNVGLQDSLFEPMSRFVR